MTTDVHAVYLNRYKTIYKLSCWMVGLGGLLNGWVHVVVVVVTLTHRYNAVLGNRTGSNTSDKPNPKQTRIPQTRIKIQQLSLQRATADRCNCRQTCASTGGTLV